MKKRIISLAIALLLVCGMPVSAFAMDDNPEGETVTVPGGETMGTNNGTMYGNIGTVEFNLGTVEFNLGTVEYNLGTVDTNDTGTVTNNYGTVDTNKSGGTVGTNNKTVNENYGKVITNSSTGTVETNNKTVTNNYGTVTTNAQNGTVTNNGTEDNNKNAVVGTNNGNVNVNHGTVDTNNRFVDYNYGTVDTNADKGFVHINESIVTTNDGNVSSNSTHGTVGTNNGTVGGNDGTVDINNGTVNNEGTVNTNNITGTVTNYSGGKVGTNYGTVIDATDNYKTTYGVQVDNGGTVSLEQKETGEELDFSQLTKDGYEFAGYTQEYRMVDGVLTKQAVTVNSTSYLADCPNILTLIWRAIAGKGESAGDGESAGYFGPGCYISVNGKQYILVEVKDGSYYLASCDEYTKEQLSDPDALLKTLLTEEQLDCVTGAAEVLNAELTETFFGGGSHIVFPCSKYLIFS